MSSTTSRSPLRHGVAVVVALVSAVAGAVLASPPAQAAALTNTVRPSIRATASGTTCVLTADRGTWTPTPTSYAYQWYVAGAAVAGATTASYTVATADAGKVVGLRVTAARAGYTPTPAQAGASLPVRVHGRLAGRTSGYQWAADGVPISGAALPTYTIGASTLGARLTISAVGGLDGYDASTTSSAPTSPVAAGGIATLREPALGGAPVVGTSLEVPFGAHQPADAFQRCAWQRDGVPVSGAVGSSNTPLRSDLGHSLSVVVTIARDGYADTVHRLAAGNVRRAPRVRVRDIRLDRAVRFMLHVTGDGRKASGKVVAKVGRRDKAVKLHHGRATVLLTRLKPGRKKYVVTYRGSTTIGPGTRTGKVTVRR